MMLDGFRPVDNAVLHQGFAYLNDKNEIRGIGNFKGEGVREDSASEVLMEGYPITVIEMIVVREDPEAVANHFRSTFNAETYHPTGCNCQTFMRAYLNRVQQRVIE